MREATSKWIRRAAATSLSALGVLLSVAPVVGQEAESLESKADEYIAPYLEMGNFSGSILVARGGEVLLSKGYGRASFELDVPTTPATCYRIGSLGKQFAAVSVLQLAEKGMLTLEDPISKFFPNYRHGKSVTVHHLMSHTSGIPEIPEMSMFLGVNDDSLSDDEIVKRLNKHPLKFKPGARFLYTNTAFRLVISVVEKASGMGYIDYVRSRIFEPLGLTDTFFDFGSPRKNRANGYYLFQSGLVNLGYVTVLGTGGICSSVDDYYKFVRGLTTGAILDRDYVERMFTTYGGYYGYAWFIGNGWGERIAYHGGDTSGYRCSVAHHFVSDLTVIAFSNVFNAPIARIRNDLAAIALGKPYSIPRARGDIAVDPGKIEDCLGSYRAENGTLVKIFWLNDYLFVAITDPEEIFADQNTALYPLYAESENDYFLKDLDVQLAIIRDAKGKPVGLGMTRDGETVEMKKEAESKRRRVD